MSLLDQTSRYPYRNGRLILKRSFQISIFLLYCWHNSFLSLRICRPPTEFCHVRISDNFNKPEKKQPQKSSEILQYPLVLDLGKCVSMRWFQETFKMVMFLTNMKVLEMCFGSTRHEKKMCLRTRLESAAGDFYDCNTI